MYKCDFIHCKPDFRRWGESGESWLMTSHDFPKVVQWGWPPLLNRTSGNDISQVHWGHSYPVTSAFTPRRDKIPADDPMKSTDEPGFRARLKWTSGSAVPHAVAAKRRWLAKKNPLEVIKSSTVSSMFSSNLINFLINCLMKSYQISSNPRKWYGVHRKATPQLQVAWENPSVYTHAA